MGADQFIKEEVRAEVARVLPGKVRDEVRYQQDRRAFEGPDFRPEMAGLTRAQARDLALKFEEWLLYPSHFSPDNRRSVEFCVSEPFNVYWSSDRQCPPYLRVHVSR